MFLSDKEKELEERKNRRRITDKCPLCKGRGTIISKDEKFKQCSCVKNVYRNVRLLDWGFPRKFLQEKWSLDLIKDRPYYDKIKKYIDNFIDNYDEGIGIFLYGSQGRGKTTIECIIAKAVCAQINPDSFEQKKHFTVGFAMYDDIIKMIIDKNPNINMFLYNADLLIIDNVGNETGKNENQFSQRTLEMILRKRNNEMLPTILSCNYQPEELISQYNQDVHDFIIQNCLQIFVTGDNFRVEKEEDEF